MPFSFLSFWQDRRLFLSFLKKEKGLVLKHNPRYLL